MRPWAHLNVDLILPRLSSIWKCAIVYRSHTLHWWLTSSDLSNCFSSWMWLARWWRSNFSPWWCVWGVCCSYSSQPDTQIDGRKVAPWVHAGMSWFRVMATTTRWSPQAFSINLWFVERVMLLWFFLCVFWKDIEMKTVETVSTKNKFYNIFCVLLERKVIHTEED